MQESFDRTPPYAPDIERAVLGAMLLEKEAIGIAIEMFAKDQDFFYKPGHSIIYRAMTDLYDEGSPVDQLTVSEYLKKRGQLDSVGGEVAIVSLAGETLSAANIRYHCQLLREKAMLRKLITMSSAVQNKCFEDTADPSDILHNLEANIMNLVGIQWSQEYKSMKNVVEEAYTELIRRTETKGGITGVPTGFKRLDKITGGWQKSDFIIIAGRPSMGKTALALDLAKNAASNEFPVGIFTLEMSSVQLVMRMLFNEGRFDGSSLHSRTPSAVEWTRLSDASSRLAKYPIFIDETPSISCMELTAKARRLKKEKSVELIIVDYLQLMQGSNRESRQQEISSISRALKALAKELNTPVMALSQLSRAIEHRGGDHKPVLSDLRESGALEQDADIVMFIYRAAAFGVEPEYTINDQQVAPEDVAEIIIRKHRNGPTGTILLHWIEEYTRFAEFTYESEVYF